MINSSHLVICVDYCSVWAYHDGLFACSSAGLPRQHELTVIRLDDDLDCLTILVDHVGNLNLLSVDPA